jgi:hypothetical protein
MSISSPRENNHNRFDGNNSKNPFLTCLNADPTPVSIKLAHDNYLQQCLYDFGHPTNQEYPPYFGLAVVEHKENKNR